MFKTSFLGGKPLRQAPSSRILALPSLLLTGIWLATSCGFAQTPYVLVSGSQLTDDCPICGRPPITVPLIGSFDLQLSQQTPLETFYDLTNISFRSGATSGLPYQVFGSGTYQVGGEVALSQQLFLDTEITNGFSGVHALCTSTNAPVTQSWPKIQIHVDQTNGTPAQVYRLTLVAVPTPQITSIVPDLKTRDVRLDWNPNGGAFVVQRAYELIGPYSVVGSLSTNSSFTDVGVLTNATRFFYRLRPF